MADWKEVTAEHDVREHEITEASAGDLKVILVKDAGEVFAYHHECPHEKHSLTKAEIEEGVIICQKHLWEFEIRTGLHITRVPMVERNLIRYPVRIVNGRVEIDVASPSRCGEA